MADIELTNSMRTTLTILANEYQATESPVPAKTLANKLDRRAGSIRNQMQSLTSLGVADSKVGPDGGYIPTTIGLEAIDREQLDDVASVTLAHEFERIDATIDKIDFTNVHHPESCRAQIHFQQAVDLEEGDAIMVGPSPVSSLVVGGEIVTADDTGSSALIDVAELQAPLAEDAQPSP